MIVAAAIQCLIWGLRGINAWRKGYLDRKVADDASSAAAIGFLATSLQGVFIITIVLIGLSNLGVDVGAMGHAG
ncbi:MAG: hypothetical protein HC902_13465, partial [Calothrix sp. SM1_5_4]|nr:hypothetical protein [Calothrix sp. SM1_5_4]